MRLPLFSREIRDHLIKPADIIVYLDDQGRAVAVNRHGERIAVSEDHAEVLEEALNDYAGRYAYVSIRINGALELKRKIVIPEPKYFLEIYGGYLYVRQDLAPETIDYIFEYEYSHHMKKLRIHDMFIIAKVTPDYSQPGFIRVKNTSGSLNSWVSISDITTFYTYPLLRFEGGVWWSAVERVRAYTSTHPPLNDPSRALIELISIDNTNTPRWNTFRKITYNPYTTSDYPHGKGILCEGHYNTFEDVFFDIVHQKAETLYVTGSFNKFIGCQFLDMANTPSDVFEGESHIYIDGWNNIFVGNSISAIAGKIIKFGANAKINKFVGNTYWSSGVIESETDNPQIFVGNSPQPGITVTYDPSLKAVVLDNLPDAVMGSTGVLSDCADLPSSGVFKGQMYVCYDSGASKWIIKVWDGSDWQTIG